MKHIAFLLIAALFSFSLRGQALPNLTTVAEKLVEYDEPSIVSAKVIYDSIIEITYHEKIKIGPKELRRVTDTVNYKLFFIFRKEKKQLAAYISSMKMLSHKIDNLDSIIGDYRDFRSFRFLKDNYRRFLPPRDTNSWGILPYKIPPTIINENYSVVIIDNMRYAASMLVKDKKSLGLYINMIKKILIIGEGNIICFYSNYMCSSMEFEMMGSFGIFDWGEIKERNYPHLFKR
jgi:hypothetical protein